jgi:hypothetical protein
MPTDIFDQAQRQWEEEPENVSVAVKLPDLGTCPYCLKELHWDGYDDTSAWCETTGCKYDNGISEEANRSLVELESLA